MCFRAIIDHVIDNRENCSIPVLALKR